MTASYAMLGDVHIAEPGAVIGFAGARVIEQTIRERLPEGFQRAEYLRVHGMVDMVVPRQQQREALARLCRLLSRSAGGRLSLPEDPKALPRRGGFRGMPPPPRFARSPSPVPLTLHGGGSAPASGTPPPQRGGRDRPCSIWLDR